MHFETLTPAQCSELASLYKRANDTPGCLMECPDDACFTCIIRDGKELCKETILNLIQEHAEQMAPYLFEVIL